MPLKRLDLTLQKHKNYAVYAVMRLIQLIINKIKAAWFTKNYAVSVPVLCRQGFWMVFAFEPRRTYV